MPLTQSSELSGGEPAKPKISLAELSASEALGSTHDGPANPTLLRNASVGAAATAGSDPGAGGEGEKAALHRRLFAFNGPRLRPGRPNERWQDDLAQELEMRLLEGRMIEEARAEVALRAAAAPVDPAGFAAWLEALKVDGPGQADPLFPWLAEEATLDQMRWFIAQEVAGEAGFDDLVAMTQVRFPVRPKLELARNYWDEMGRGNAKGMHAPMLERIAIELDIVQMAVEPVWQAQALTNTMVALASNRRYAYHSVGALGAIEMTAPGRVQLVDRGLERLGISGKSRHYFALHAVLDVKHWETWRDEVVLPLVATEPEAVTPLAEGALLRLTCGARCFERYRAHFGLGAKPTQATL